MTQPRRSLVPVNHPPTSTAPPLPHCRPRPAPSHRRRAPAKPPRKHRLSQMSQRRLFSRRSHGTVVPGEVFGRFVPITSPSFLRSAPAPPPRHPPYTARRLPRVWRVARRASLSGGQGRYTLYLCPDRGQDFDRVHPQVGRKIAKSGNMDSDRDRSLSTSRGQTSNRGRSCPATVDHSPTNRGGYRPRCNRLKSTVVDDDDRAQCAAIARFG